MTFRVSSSNQKLARAMTSTPNAVSHVAKQPLGQTPRVQSILGGRVSPSTSTFPGCNDWASWKTSWFSPLNELAGFVSCVVVVSSVVCYKQFVKICNFIYSSGYLLKVEIEQGFLFRGQLTAEEQGIRWPVSNDLSRLKGRTHRAYVFLSLSLTRLTS